MLRVFDLEGTQLTVDNATVPYSLPKIMMTVGPAAGTHYSE